MRAKSLIVILFLATGLCRADVEDQLLKKFQSQNQSAADKLKQTVTGNLDLAASPGSKEDPAKLRDLLRKNLAQLHEDTYLPKNERDSLIVKVQKSLKDLKQAVAEKSQKDKIVVRLEPGTGSLGLPDYQANAGMPTIIPGIMSGGPRGIAPSSAFTVTPVVGPDRTFVRVNISGTFTIPTMGPVVPIQIPVPSIFYGPGRKFTAGQQEKILQIFLPFASSETLGVNTTVMVPDGGTAVLGGFQSSAEARNEFGPPGLGKVPYLNRLFNNTAYGKQTTSSRIGVSVRIISMEEEERKLLGK